MKPPSRLPAATSRRVRDRLGGAPDGPLRVLHRGPHAVYLDLHGWCLGVVDSAAAQVPCALRVRSLAGVRGERAAVRDGVLHLDDVAVPVGRIVDVAVPPLPAGVAARPGDAAERVASAGPGGWVAALVGAGDGLTPYGDDVLCGWLALHRAAGVATPSVDARVRALLRRTTLLSATLLDCALAGEVLPEYAAWVRALGSPAEPEAAVRLAAVGHSSGRGLLAGGRQALAELTRAVAA